MGIGWTWAPPLGWASAISRPPAARAAAAITATAPPRPIVRTAEIELLGVGRGRARPVRTRQRAHQRSSAADRESEDVPAGRSGAIASDDQGEAGGLRLGRSEPGRPEAVTAEPDDRGGRRERATSAGQPIRLPDARRRRAARSRGGGRRAASRRSGRGSASGLGHGSAMSGAPRRTTRSPRTVARTSRAETRGSRPRP